MKDILVHSLSGGFEDQTNQGNKHHVSCTDFCMPMHKCLLLKSVAISGLRRLAKGKGRGREILLP